MFGNQKSQSLRKRVFALIGAGLLIFVLLFFLIFQTSMTTLLTDTESSYLDEEIRAVQGALVAADENLLRMAGDMAYWEDTLLFAKGEFPEHITKNWSETYFLQGYRFNLVAIKNVRGEDVYVDFYDYLAGEALPVPDGFSAALNHVADEVLAKYADRRAQNALDQETYRRGIFFHDGQPYNICTVPIALEGGEAAGTLTFGNRLDEAYFRDLTQYTQTEFALITNDGSSDASSYRVERQEDDRLMAVLSLNDIDGRPVELRLSKQRATFRAGQQAVQETMLWLIFVIFIFFALIYGLTESSVLRPILALSDDIRKVETGAAIDPEKHAKVKEIHDLSVAVNDMVTRQRQSNISVAVFKSIFDGMDAYLYVTDPETDELLYVNERLRTHFGFPEDMVGHKCWEFFHPEKEGRCEHCPVHALEQDPDSVVVWEERSPFTKRHYKNTDCMIGWTDDRRVHLQHRTDITETKRAEASLSKRFDQQKLMADLAQNFISGEEIGIQIDRALQMIGDFMGVERIMVGALTEEKDTLGIQFDWYADKEGIKRLSNYQYPFVEGDGLYDGFVRDKCPYIACDDIDKDPLYAGLESLGVRAFLDVALTVSGAFWGLLIVDNCDEAYHWTDSDVQLVQLIASMISGAIARDETEEALVRMSSIVDSAPQYISYISGKGRFEYINQSVVEITGYPRELLMRSGVELLLDEDTARFMREEAIPMVRKQGRHDFDLPIIRKDGEVRIMAFSCFRTGFKTFGIGAIASDITEKLQLERDLVAAKEQAEQSNVAKSNFLSRMSHEMRTPMNAIIGMTNIAKTTDDMERKDYCLEKIDEASNHLLGVINDILDMSKIEAGKFELSYTDFDFERMLMRVTDVVNFRIDEKNLNFIVDVDENIPARIESDEQRLAQVVTNLLSNAVKFTPEGGTITLTAKLIEERDSMCMLRIAVSDNGIGISEEQRSRLFQSFEQADGGISRKYGGTGLGLAISKNIIELMGGKIWVESELNKGSDFIFTIQAKRGGARHKSLLSPQINWSNLRVLVVDDAPEVRDYFANLADTISLHCEVAASGEEACAMIDQSKDNPFSIVFVDWKMPGMNGIELARRIKEEYGENTVVIMISATEWSMIEEEAKDAGVDRFVPKPLFSSRIVDCINECLGVRPDDHEQKAVTQTDRDCFKGKKILLVEDIEINREIVISLLEETGVEIECATNGIEAIAMFKRNPEYDMIFMDIHMPEMDGYEATRRIRAMRNVPQAGTVPIVAMTANVFREDIEKCIRAGMNSHVGKPIDMDDIMAVMRRYLGC